MKFLKLSALALTITLLPCGSSQATAQNPTVMQKRYCLAFDLRKDPALIAQYKHVHTREGIWPEIPKGIKAVGIKDMEIYLWDTRMFMVLETPLNWDYDTEMAKLGKLERQQEWGDFVWQFQQFLPYSKNGEKWMHMESVFHLNPAGLTGTATTGYTEPVYDKPTKRYCATLDLKDDPELIREYRRYHSPAVHWPEIANGIRSVGILDMQIYLIGNRMFMVAQTVPEFDWDAGMKKLSMLERQPEWASLMSKFQQKLPGTKTLNWELMENVFDLDRDF
jgi:L-rhamnose mutarotase